MYGKRIVGAVGALALVATMGAGCGLLRGDDDKATPRGETKVKIAVTTTVDTGPAWLAAKRGYFKDENLDVDFVPVKGGGGAALAKLFEAGKGHADIAFATYAPVFAAEQQHAAQAQGGMKIVADGSYASAGSALVVAPPNSRVKHIQDLPGATVAVTDPSSISVQLILSALHDNNIDASFEDIHWAATLLPDTAPALARGDVDAAFVVDPWIQDAATKRGGNSGQIFDVSQGFTRDFPSAGWASTGNFVSEHREAVAGFQRAMQRATNLALNDRAQLDAMSVAHAGVSEDVAKTMTPPTLVSSLDPRRLNRVPALINLYGKHKVTVTAEQLIVPTAPID